GVLGAIEAPGCDASGVLRYRGVRALERALDVFSHRVEPRLRRSRRGGRWHVASSKPPQHFLPHLALLDERLRGRDLLDVQTAREQPAVVALRAGFGEHWSHSG